MAIKKYHVSVWGRPLYCPVCGGNTWNRKIIRLTDFENPYTNDVRTMAECTHCANSLMFGAKTNWDTNEDNLSFEETY